MLIRDRIRELRRVPASQLRPHPHNWRFHPPAQRDALQGLLAELGYCDAVLARELPDGTLELIDGHLRCATTPDTAVPVLVLDVTEQEADKLLLTLDPLAGLAEVTPAALRQLLETVEVQNAGVAAMLQGMATAHGITLPDATGTEELRTPPQEFPEYGEGIETQYQCPRCAYQWSGKPK